MAAVRIRWRPGLFLSRDCPNDVRRIRAPATVPITKATEAPHASVTVPAPRGRYGSSFNTYRSLASAQGIDHSCAGCRGGRHTRVATARPVSTPAITYEAVTRT